MFTVAQKFQQTGDHFEKAICLTDHSVIEVHISELRDDQQTSAHSLLSVFRGVNRVPANYVSPPPPLPLRFWLFFPRGDFAVNIHMDEQQGICL